MMFTCPLKGYETFCAGNMQRHHIINKSKLKGNKKARHYVDVEYPHVFLVEICANHNVSRWADTDTAAGILLKHKVDLYGMDYVRSIWDNIPWKVPRPESRFDALFPDAPDDLVDALPGQVELP